MSGNAAEADVPVMKHKTHIEYTFLTPETAAAHTMHEIASHFHGTEQGAKSAMTRKGIAETKDMVHDPKRGWVAKAAATEAVK